MKDSESRSRSTEKVFFGLGSALMVLVLLYFGKPVLLPIALSVLLAFILNPVVQVLEGWRLGRLVSVLIASGMAFAIIGLAIWALASQVQSLARDLPNHKNEIRLKLESFKASENSTLGRLNAMFEELFPGRSVETLVDEADPQIKATDKATDSIAKSEVSDPSPAKVVVVRDPAAAPASFETASAMLLPIVEPLGVGALVVVLVIFLLIQREDVRYRTISLMGDSALTGTTRLMRDAADRVSQYLLYLLGVNAVFGLWFGVGLYFLGVPYAPLWGFLTLCFRFIPFVGSPVSVLLPLACSIATSSGWTQPVWVAIFFAVSELVTVNVIEPLLFGKSTGLTPIALLIAVLFWTWVWGPVGLLLSTPLTVCLVVLGQHIPKLRSLRVLLAEQPVLDARLQYFQRLIAGDADEGNRMVASFAEEMGRERAYDEVIVPALRWTRQEREKENITAAEERFIRQSTIDAVSELVSQPAKETKTQSETSADSENQTVPNPDRKFRIYCHPVHHEFEEIAQLMLQDMMSDRCVTQLSSTKVLPSRVVDEVSEQNPDAVVLTVMPPGGIPQVRYLCQSIRKRSPGTSIIVAYLGKLKDYDEMLVQLRKEGASSLATSLSQTAQQIGLLIEKPDTSDILPIYAPSGNPELSTRAGVEYAE